MTKEERINDFVEYWTKRVDPVKDMMCSTESLVNFLDENGFFTAPASAKYHGNVEGGLYVHSKAVCHRLEMLTHNNELTWTLPRSPYVVGMFHDLCKCDDYVEKQGTLVDQVFFNYGTHYEYNPNPIFKGHGAKSVMFLSQLIKLTEEEVVCIRYHMGAYEKDDWAELDRAIKKYENVLWTHQADMLACKVDDV